MWVIDGMSGANCYCRSRDGMPLLPAMFPVPVGNEFCEIYCMNAQDLDRNDAMLCDIVSFLVVIWTCNKAATSPSSTVPNRVSRRAMS